MAKDSFIRQKHQEYAQSLRDMHFQLGKMASELTVAYGKPSAYYAKKAQDAIASLRGLLAETLYAEHSECDQDEAGPSYFTF
ncbi:hypothetical protein Pcar_1773 [Syntrophotalea carbinolica DSM 2380]|uniref:Uncharacterized protein n=1 Tax=Syntrophotalea carbinolica (strain DSM 2380 / NBRC 103641 / GraBd1) TaxID=338963 RepID=Q3A3P1_SYNC1|nr:hypothetical protein [Syntrophotalea carbinolica]ABA89016.1 hypothetical protein Pcar_1773 [Syntrophotalea carbinolica DSM 2380]